MPWHGALREVPWPPSRSGSWCEKTWSLSEAKTKGQKRASGAVISSRQQFRSCHPGLVYSRALCPTENLLPPLPMAEDWCPYWCVCFKSKCIVCSDVIKKINTLKMFPSSTIMIILGFELPAVEHFLNWIPHSLSGSNKHEWQFHLALCVLLRDVLWRLAQAPQHHQPGTPCALLSSVLNKTHQLLYTVQPYCILSRPSFSRILSWWIWSKLSCSVVSSLSSYFHQTFCSLFSVCSLLEISSYVCPRTHVHLCQS